MSVINVPTTLPSPGQLDLFRSELIGQLVRVSELLMVRANELMKAERAPELAAVVLAVERDVAETNQAWTGLSGAMHKLWGF